MSDAIHKFVSYQPHPLLGLFPESCEEDLGSMEVSVLETGVQQKIRLWDDARGKRWLIDGRTRQGGAERAFRRRLEADPTAEPLADNGVRIQPEFEMFGGTLDDVFAFVQSTHIRKHYNPGQKAGMGVKVHYHDYKKRHGGKLPSVEDEANGEDGLSAEVLAAKYGVNRYYIQICRQLYRKAPDLLDTVCMGVIPPVKAMAALKEREAGNPPDAPGDDDTTADKREDAGDVIVDDDGVPATDKNREALEARAVFKELRRHLQRVRTDCEKMAGRPGFEFVDSATLDAQIGSVMKHLAGATPHVTCAKCEGSAKMPGRRPCPRCKGSGVVPRAVLKQEEKAAKEAAETGADPDGAAAE